MLTATPFLSRALARLRAPGVRLVDVARGSGVPYDTLKKIASGATPNPGVLHIERINGYFDEVDRRPIVPLAGSLAATAAAAMNAPELAQAHLDLQGGGHA